jgi:uncharacterized protein YceK
VAGVIFYKQIARVLRGMKIKGFFALGITCIVLVGCGSISTIPKSDHEIRFDLSVKKTKCDTIPRLYSGVAYDFCRLHAEPAKFYNEAVLSFYLFDFMFSGVVDTVALPYSGYLQYKTGNIDLN